MLLQETLSEDRREEYKIRRLNYDLFSIFPFIIMIYVDAAAASIMRMIQIVSILLFIKYLRRQQGETIFENLRRLSCRFTIVFAFATIFTQGIEKIKTISND